MDRPESAPIAPVPPQRPKTTTPSSLPLEVAHYGLLNAVGTHVPKNQHWPTRGSGPCSGNPDLKRVGEWKAMRDGRLARGAVTCSFLPLSQRMLGHADATGFGSSASGPTTRDDIMGAALHAARPAKRRAGRAPRAHAWCGDSRGRTGAPGFTGPHPCRGQIVTVRCARRTAGARSFHACVVGHLYRRILSRVEKSSHRGRTSHDSLWQRTASNWSSALPAHRVHDMGGNTANLASSVLGH
jgi:hypothetical protein